MGRRSLLTTLFPYTTLFRSTSGYTSLFRHFDTVVLAGAGKQAATTRAAGARLTAGAPRTQSRRSTSAFSRRRPMISRPLAVPAGGHGDGRLAAVVGTGSSLAAWVVDQWGTGCIFAPNTRRIRTSP